MNAKRKSLKDDILAIDALCVQYVYVRIVELLKGGYIWCVMKYWNSSEMLMMCWDLSVQCYISMKYKFQVDSVVVNMESKV